MLLQDYRRQHGISKYRAAKELDVHWMTLHRWERGQHEPQPEMMKKVREWSGGMVTEWPKLVAH